MVKKDIYYPSSDGKTTIHAIRWEPEGEAKAIVQIIHGMCEYIGRYDEFATFLAENNYIVCGEDHLGHGESVISEEYRGYFGDEGNAYIISDIHRLRTDMHEEFPDLPYLMLGHSMGSFLLRQYLTEENGDYAKGLAGAVVMGTAWQPDAVLKLGKGLAKIRGTKKTGTKCPLIGALSFGTYLKRIKKPRTASDWLTKDSEIVDAYRATPWCNFHFTANAYYHMFDGMLKAHDTERMKNLPENMPLLLTSGTEDPVGNWGEGVRKAYMKYLENSPCKVDICLYEGDRHEILNETDRADVFKDLQTFFDNCLENYRDTCGGLPAEE